MDGPTLLDPEFGIYLTKLFSWILIGLGLLKGILYLIGELFPGAFKNVKSDAVRNFLTGKGNRLLFGLGGFLTVLIGLAGLFAAYFLSWALDNGFL